MEPIDPQDPLWNLLGKSQQPKVRPQFLANVVREARNTAQDRGAWSRIKGWWSDLTEPLPMGRLLAATAVVVAVAMVSLSVLDPAAPVSTAINLISAPAAPIGAVGQKVAEVPLVPEVETQLESLDYLDALLAVEDTSGFTDIEIAYLLY